MLDQALLTVVMVLVMVVMDMALVLVMVGITGDNPWYLALVLQQLKQKKKKKNITMMTIKHPLYNNKLQKP